MKNTQLYLFISFFFFLQILFISGITQNNSGLYDQKIFVDPAIKEGITLESLNDLKIYLQKATGKDFSVTSAQTSLKSGGIYILLNKPASISADLQKKLTNGSIEDFVISGDGQKLYLVASHPVGLSRAIYTYLDKLGFRWYFPGAKWSYTPQLTNITITLTQYCSPSFQLRNFTGTGGMPHVKSIDPDFLVWRAWEDWKRRNRMGGDVELAGHYGDVFNYKYQSELQKHPEYLALVGGKRTGWHPDAKWCISNAALRKLFIQDRVQEGKEALAKTIFPNKKITITVDPADGYGDCECADCKKMGSYSERAFYLANEAAKELSKLSPQLYANVLAYNTHAAAPSFSLSANLVVQIIPYAFQTVGTPVEMIDAWRKKSKNLLIYDYYGIPDWHYDLPLTGGWSPDALVNKLRYWKSQNLKGFSLESSYSIGSVGLGLYLAGRLGWDINTDVTGTKEQFYKDIFGTAAPAIKEYFQKMANDFRGVADMPYMLNLLEQAHASALSIPVKDRVEDMQAYLHYVLLYYQWQSAPTDKKDKAWEELMAYAWKIYPSAMIHSTRIAELLIATLPAGNNQGKSWSVYEPVGDKIKQTKFAGSKETQMLFKANRKKYPVLEGFSSVNSPAIQYTIKPATKPDEANPEGMMLMDIPETYIQPATDSYFRFMLKVNEGSENNLKQTVQVQIIDAATGKDMYNHAVAIDAVWKKLAIKLDSKKTYKLQIKPQNWIRLHIPKDQWAGFKNIPTYAVMGKLWFYVPAGTKYIYYSNEGDSQPVFTDESGKQVTQEKVNDQFLHRINTTFTSGRWWAITSSEYKRLQFYNKPDLFFTHPNYSLKPVKP